MSALLYAIAGCRPDAVPAVTATGQRLRTIGDEPPVAILAAEAGPATATGADTLWAHEQAVAELMHIHTLLPARFGTRLSESEAAELVRERRAGLLAALERVRDAVEVAVTAQLNGSAGEDGAGGPGTAYMRSRLAEQHAVARARSWLEPLHELARAEAGGRVADGRLRCAYLVGRDRLTAFLACAEALDSAHPELALVCTGPWPPYSFSGGWR